MGVDHSIPFIDIRALFGTPSHARDLTDQAIMATRNAVFPLHGLMPL